MHGPRRIVGLVMAMAVAACGGGPADASPARSVGPASAAASLVPAGSVSSSGPSAPRSSSGNVLAGRFDIGRGSLFLECQGTGRPTIILDTGLGGDSGSWGRVAFLPLLTPLSRWCVWDRFNRGRSDAAPGPRTSADVVADLHDLLTVAGIEPPYLLVASSFGGYNVRLYAATHPDEVAGVVLSETVTPAFVAGLEERLPADLWAVEARSYRGLTEPELDFLASGLEVAAAADPPQDVPWVVAAATERHLGNEEWPPGWPADELDALWDREQAALAKLSPRGRLVVFADTPHRIHLARPADMAALIGSVLAEIRAGT